MVDGCEKPKFSGAGHCSMHARRLSRTGTPGGAASTRQQRDGIDPNGYRRIQRAGLPAILEHRLVVETLLGRPLESYEYVHHKNGIRHDNVPNNLELWVTPQPKGQRPEDLAEWVVGNYPELVRAALNGEPLRLF